MVKQSKVTVFENISNYPQIKILDENWKIIMSEIPYFDSERKYPRRTIAWPTNMSKIAFEEYLSTFTSQWYQGWQGEHVWYNFPLTYNNNIIGTAEKMCPKTIEILKKIDCKQIVGYSLLLPKSKLSTHADPTGKKYNSMAGNLLLTDNNDKAYLYVNDYSYLHKQGKMVIFDSTNLHSADNNDCKNRVILYIDFKTDI